MYTVCTVACGTFLTPGVKTSTLHRFSATSYICRRGFHASHVGKETSEDGSHPGSLAIPLGLIIVVNKSATKLFTTLMKRCCTGISIVVYD
jgi:hypothetical protein